MASRKKRLQRQKPAVSKADELRAVQPHSRFVHFLPQILIATSFLSAFLLFQVQPLISKIILPWFGGSPAVWTTSMFFFQTVLLLGYCYAFLITKFLSTTMQVVTHVTLVTFAILLLPIYPSETWANTAIDAHPAWNVLLILSQSVGVQFFLLSSTAPLTQVWWQRVSRQSPYWLYAVSNGGSLLALLSYPFLLEPALGMKWQAFAWAIVFTGVATLIITCVTSLIYSKSNSSASTNDESSLADESSTTDEPPSWTAYLAWIGLSSCGSILLLAMTNHFSQNVAVVPFLWVMPLAVYLLSFILTFSEKRIYRSSLFGSLMIVFMTICSLVYAHDEVVRNILLLLFIHLAALFGGCMICHGELVKLKPSAKYLTNFYLAVSAGGALGGFFISFIAPQIFLQYFEYPIVLTACWIIFIAVSIRDKSSYLAGGRPLWAWALIILLFASFGSYIKRGVHRQTQDAFLLRRNFYGVLGVCETYRGDDVLFRLMHGTILHGEQYLDPEKRNEPTSYYARTSGLGYAMKYLDDKPNKRVGMLGLGTGTIAAYCKPGDVFRAYEINPDVIDLATTNELFSYWDLFRQRNASGVIIKGDARLSLEQETRNGESQNFDLLVLDVFSGDAIPVHLITKECFSTYLKQLSPDGILAIHISNRHIDLLPVISALTKHNNLDWGYLKDNKSGSNWVLVTNKKAFNALVQFGIDNKEVARLRKTATRPVMWTDDFSNIFSVLK